ncbi:MAG: SigB/SigF/SigG family RNA polymerase sigma factor [Lachnospirales bacterium]
MDRIHNLIKEAQNGNKEAFEYIINENIGLIWSIVKKFQGRNIDNDDLFQLGSMGLVKAVKNFNFNFNVKFSTYAVPMILGEIKRFIRDDGIIKVSRGLKETAFKAMKAREILIMNGNKEPTIDEIAEYINIDKETIILSMNASQEVDSIDRNLSNDKGKEINVIDTIVSEDDKSEKIVNNILLKQTLKKLEDKEKMIITMRYIEELTQSQVAKKIGVSQVQVSRLEKKILLKMREYMAS